MSERDSKQNPEEIGRVEYQVGCPLCEHSDPEWERELQAWAQLLYDHFSSKQQPNHSRVTVNVDFDHESPTLKERSKNQSTQIQQT